MASDEESDVYDNAVITVDVDEEEENPVDSSRRRTDLFNPFIASARNRIASKIEEALRELKS